MSNIIKQKLEIKNMHCASCALSIDFDLEDLPGVKSVSTKYAKGECEVEFDEDEVTLEKILNQVELTGYSAIPI